MFTKGAHEVKEVKERTLEKFVKNSSRTPGSFEALASLFGRQVLVFNCDEGIDVHSISRIFVGIVQCGAWGCFDEFNRLDQTVLSAVSMQIQTIQDVIKSKSGTCVLGGKTASVDPNAAIFITLNPAGKGYGGRQKMPDNLKQLFRPVVMSVPDNDVIAETILYSEGFTEARTLARKIVAVFTLSKEMLSMQQHYDWGLRALKVVLRGCGDLRASKPDASESEIVVQALLLNTLSKLTSSDSKRFNVLIDDIFSTVNKERATLICYGNWHATNSLDPNAAIFITLNPAGKGYGGRQKMPDNLKQLFRPVVMSVPDNDVIAETILYSEGFTEARTLARKIVAVFTLSKEMLSMQQHYDWGLRALKVVLRGCGDLRASKPDASETEIVVQLQKVFQLYEQLRQRIGVVVVGPTGAGKSTIWRVLKRAQILAGVALKTVSFNPKAMNRTKLLGHMDIDTREWSDGILTMVAREVIKDTSVHTWIIFDGDIDPEWVEALNSVLDDNRLLTMPSGERIQFGSNVNFLFETDSLQFASPATVSRMGMIFISEEDVSAKEIVTQWTKTLSDEHPDLPDWVDQNFYSSRPGDFRCYDWCLAAGLVNGVGKVAALHNGLSHLRGSKCSQQFLVNLFRGLSSVIDSEKKRDFAATVFQSGLFVSPQTHHGFDELIAAAGTPLPDVENPELVYYDSRSDSLMRYQDDVGMGVNLDDLKGDTKPFILTASAQSNRDTVLSWLSNSNRQPFIVVGPDGCGKEELLKHCFTEDSHSQLAIVHCTAQSRASAILQCLSQHCVQTSSASGRVLRPKDRAQLILYLKSLNLPAPDK
ncbi:ATPase family protein, partial [Ancylostoma caninum]